MTILCRSNTALAGTVDNLKGLVDEFAGLSAADLDLDTGARPSSRMASFSSTSSALAISTLSTPPGSLTGSPSSVIKAKKE